MPTSLNITLHGGYLTATDESGHSVNIPCDVNGVRMLKLMLTAKQLEPNGKLGSNAKMTQDMINAFLKSIELEKQNAMANDLNELSEIF